jgi:hypothetical protein
VSNEIISISSSDGDDFTIVGDDSTIAVFNDSTIIELLSPLPVKSEAADDQRVTSVPNITIPVRQLDAFLRSKPCCIMKQSKHNLDRSKRYEYRHCACGCSYRITLMFTFANSTVLVKETHLPPTHDSSDDRVISRHIRVTKDMLGYINLLAEPNLFTPNYGAKKVVRALREEFSVEESLIPPDLQINNHFSYCRSSRLNHTNMIDVVEAQLGRFVLKGDEEDCQPFIYLYDKDSQGR